MISKGAKAEVLLVFQKEYNFIVKISKKGL